LGITDRPRREIQPEQQPALIKNGRLRRVEILWIVLCRQRPRPEPDYTSAFISDWDHQAVAEAVIHLSLLVADGDSRVHQIVFAVSHPGEHLLQRVPTGGRVANLKAHDGFFA